MDRARGMACLAVAGIALTACAGTPADTGHPTQTLAATPAAPTPDSTGSLGHAEPSWDAVSRRSATSAGEKVMTAFARPRLSEKAWWAGLEPLLSPGARTSYAAVDPSNVPANAVTGRGKLLEETSAYIARVQVPTNVGPYTVVLSRDAADAEWEGERITPPDGVN